MAGEDDVVMRLDADGSSTEEVLASIEEGVNSLASSIAALAETAGDFSALDDAMAELSAMTAQGAEEAAALGESMAEASGAIADTSAQIDGLNSVIDQLSSTIAEDTAIISGLNEQITNLEAQIAMLTEEEAGASEGAGGLAAMLGTAGEAATALGEQIQTILGPLMMVATVAALVGGQLVGMGMSGQKGEALLRGMAGASQSDIQALESDALKLGESMDQASAGFYEVESAGYAGADAIKVFDAASKLAEGGQASQQDTMSGLTAIMHDYNAGANDATQYTDLMAEAIVRGKQSAQDFTSNIGPLAAAAANVGISFDQVTAAESTMTQINPHVRQDTQELASLFNFLSPTMGGVVDKAKSLGLAFDEQKYSSLDLIGKLQYLSDLAGGTSTKAFAELTGGAMGSKAAIDLMQNGAQSFIGNLDAMQHSTGATQHAFEEFENTVPAHLDKIGAALSIFATKFMDAVGPKVIPVIDKITSAVGTMGDWILQHTDLLVPALGALAAVIGTVLVGAVVSFVAASWPIILILTGIGVVVGGVIYAFTHWGDIMGAIGAAMQNPWIAAIADMLHGVWSFLVSSFIPVWQELVDVWNTQIVPEGHQLMDLFEQSKPALILLAEIVGVTLVIAFGLLIGVIGGFIKGLAGVISGVIEIVGGIVQMIRGQIQVVEGIVSFIADLFTGHFDKLNGDLKTIFGGITTTFSGFGNVVKGIFDGIVKGITGTVSGFADSVVGYFDNIVHGVDNKTKEASNTANVNTLEMKDKVVKNAIDTDTQTIEKYDHMRQGIIEQLTLTKDETEKKSLETKLAQVNHVEQTAIDVRNKHVQMHNDIMSQLDKLKKESADKFGSIQKDIQNIVGNVTKWIQDRWHDAVNFVVDKFEWLYNHNYYFHDLVDNVEKAVENGKKWLEDTWQNIIKTAEDKFKELVHDAEQLWNDFAQPFREAWGVLKPHIDSLWNSFTSTVSGWITTAENWGSNFLNSFIKGLEGKIGDLQKTLGNIGDQIAKTLGFHSPTEYLPDADEWAPNFMAMFIAGIEASNGRLKQVVESTGQILSQGLNAQLQTSLQPQISTVLTLPPTSLLPPGPTQSGNDQAISLLAQIAQTLLQMLQQQKSTGSSMQQQNVTFNATQGSSINAQQLYQLIQSLSGYGYENTLRGSY